MILRTIVSVVVLFAVIAFYHDKDEVPGYCVALIAASLIGQVFVLRWGNLLPWLRAWLVIGLLAILVYPTETVTEREPRGISCVAAGIGFCIVVFFSMLEGRTFWEGTRVRRKIEPDDE